MKTLRTVLTLSTILVTGLANASISDQYASVLSEKLGSCSVVAPSHNGYTQELVDEMVHTKSMNYRQTVIGINTGEDLLENKIQAGATPDEAADALFVELGCEEIFS